MLQATDTTVNRSVGRRSVIDEAKERVPVIHLADRLCGAGAMRRVGKEWVGRCPTRDHEDRVPSFCVNPEKNLWFCHGCVRGGDVVKLAALVWDHARMDTAAAEVLYTFGHEIPPRPASWARKQERQKAVRDVIHEAKVEVLARRLWKYVFEPIVADIEDPEERAQVAEELWTKVVPYAARMLEDRTLGVAS